MGQLVGGERAQVIGCSPEVDCQVDLRVFEPAQHRLGERGHADLPREHCLALFDTSLPQAGRKGLDQGGLLGQLAFSQRRGRGNDRLARFGEPPVAAKQGKRGSEGVEQHRQWVETVRCVGDATLQVGAQRGLAVEQDLPLVPEVPEERAFGNPGAVGDLGGGRAVVSALAVQVQGGLLEA